jgi:hypothetical protein
MELTQALIVGETQRKPINEISGKNLLEIAESRDMTKVKQKKLSSKLRYEQEVVRSTMTHDSHGVITCRVSHQNVINVLKLLA